MCCLLSAAPLCSRPILTQPRPALQLPQYADGLVRKQIMHIARARNCRETKASLDRIAQLFACTGGKERKDVLEQLEQAVCSLRAAPEAWDGETECLYQKIVGSVLAL